MNQLATNTERLPMDQVGMSTGSNGAKIAPQNLGEVVKFAEVMCRADIALPKHLRGNAGACMAVSLQALDWQMNPFAVASKSYSVNGTIAYEAQLIIAVINTRSGIEGRLEYSFEGEGGDRVCIASGKLDGKVLEVRSPKFKDITPKNSPLWKSDPDQQHCYYTGRSWGRRHTPEVILGVYDRDEVEEFRGPDNARDVTPKASLSARLAQSNSATQQANDEREGFTASPAADERSDALTGEILPNTNSDDETPASSSDNAGNTPVDEAGAESPSDAPASTDPERDILIRFAAEMLPMAATAKTEVWKDVEKGWSEGEMKTLSEAGKAKAKSISQSIRAIALGNVSLESAAEFHAEVLDWKASDLGGVDG
ncbi:MULTISPECIES: hypothetical protein [Agrobacterium tumefaciens complex]|nr:hypothetical protein [Agrobacterium tumefaciens]KWT88043.1 hypothetical protein ASB65_18600 [Agrobacterium tumefaciens str. B6]MQB28159.1 hypothetical protein [Agrobacterium tumefaciens]NTA05035.1 recombinase RecT [Agrobacterium tumefaciens]NTA91630.1 recombinase RecT [Agrobacterium tumefaciens]NTB12780.1 recombinase RecT [Agrobacterium tumefaciens]